MCLLSMRCTLSGFGSVSGRTWSVHVAQPPVLAALHSMSVSDIGCEVVGGGGDGSASAPSGDRTRAQPLVLV